MRSGISTLQCSLVGQKLMAAKSTRSTPTSDQGTPYRRGRQARRWWSWPERGDDDAPAAGSSALWPFSMWSGLVMPLSAIRSALVTPKLVGDLAQRVARSGPRSTSDRGGGRRHDRGRGAVVVTIGGSVPCAPCRRRTPRRRAAATTATRHHRPQTRTAHGAELTPVRRRLARRRSLARRCRRAVPRGRSARSRVRRIDVGGLASRCTSGATSDATRSSSCTAGSTSPARTTSSPRARRRRLAGRRLGPTRPRRQRARRALRLGRRHPRRDRR